MAPDQAVTRAGLLTPAGRIRVAAQDGRVISAGWRIAPDDPADPVLRRALSEIRAYFAGTLQQFTVPLRPQVTGFQARFLAALADIPFGETRTYGDLAREPGVPAQTIGQAIGQTIGQAIGQACGANPIPLLIACHRVPGASGLGGYSGAGGVETKVALLRREGAGSLLL